MQMSGHTGRCDSFSLNMFCKEHMSHMFFANYFKTALERTLENMNYAVAPRRSPYGQACSNE